MIPARFAAPALADDVADVNAAIEANYAAHSSFDKARYRSTTTDVCNRQPGKSP
jgi:hypothetical protein